MVRHSVSLVHASVVYSMVMVLAATSPRLFKLMAPSLRLPAALSVAVDCLLEVLLGLMDTLLASAVVIVRLRERHTTSQQP